MQLSLRPRNAADDRAFGLALYAASRAAELEAVAWPVAMREAFLAQQHGLREAHYAALFPQAEDCSIVVDAEPVGRLCVARTGDVHTVVDLALLPAAQGRGIGSSLLRRLQAECAEAGRTLELQVTADNPGAERLYRRLGFRWASEADAGQLYRTMQWRSEALALA